MKKPSIRILLVTLVLASIACQAVTRLAQVPVPTAVPVASPTSPGATATLTPEPPSPTPSPTLAATATFTPIPATPTFTVTPSNTPVPVFTPSVLITPTPAAVTKQLKVFEQLWKAVHDEYLYPDFNGLDWDAVHTEYADLIKAGLTQDDFYEAMRNMIERLGDNHSVFLSPADAKVLDQEMAGTYNYVGVGIITESVPERDRVTITSVFSGSPAQAAGLKLHDSILEVNGEPILDENGNRRETLLGPEGSQVEIKVQTPGQEPRLVKLIRKRIHSGLTVYHQVMTTTIGKRVGYMLLTTFDDSTVPRKVEAAIQEMNGDGQLHGLILDNRLNPGGASDVLERVLNLFVKGPVGYFYNRQERIPIGVDGKNLLGSQNIPLVVMVGPGTASFGEIFSGILQDIGRAFIIGEPSEGNVEILSIFNFADGSRAWIAHDAFRPLKHPDLKWEGVGIIPDLEVKSNWDEVTQETDPAIRAALDHLDAQ